MLEMGVFEAKNRFTEILKWVQNGEEIRITRHGKPIAVMKNVAENDAPSTLSTFSEWRKLVNTINATPIEMTRWIQEKRP